MRMLSKTSYPDNQPYMDMTLSGRRQRGVWITSVSQRLKRIFSWYTSAFLLCMAYVTTGTWAAYDRISSACGSAHARTCHCMHHTTAARLS